MPERVTPEERLISLAIEKARKAKEELTAKKRENIEPTQIGEVEHEAEDAKLKRPKAQADKTKIKTQSEETHSGYGLAGQEIKKSYLREQGNQYYLQMNYKRTYPRDDVMRAISSLGITVDKAKMNSQSAEHLEYLLNIDNPNYPIPRDRMVRILNKKYNLNLRQDGPSMYDRKVSRPSFR